MNTNTFGRNRNRPLRPVERQGMRDWLKDRLDERSFAGLEWVEQSEGIFRIKWYHGSRHGWSNKEIQVFQAWARHTGRYESKNEDHKRWKANFRCAIHSLKDVKELKNMSETKGHNAYRVFKIHSLRSGNKKEAMSSLNSRHDRVEMDLYVEEQDDGVGEASPTWSLECARETMQDTENEHTAIESQVQPPQRCYDHSPEVPLPDIFEIPNLPLFEKINPDLTKIEFGKRHSIPRHHSGFTVRLGKSPDRVLPRIILPDALSPRVLSKTSLPPAQLGTSVPQQPFTNDHMMFPETPEDSQASLNNQSPAPDELQLVNTTLLEVTPMNEVDTSDQMNDTIQADVNGTMQSMVTSSDVLTSPSNKTDTVWPLMNTFYPLTPP